jgi:hypothetical protein
MNEVEIPIKLTGIAGLKAELKDLKNEMADAVNPDQMAALADKAGDVQKKITAINTSISTFKKGSNLDQAKASFEGLTHSITELDFTKAAKQSQNLKQVLGELKPSDLTKQFTDFITTIKNIGGAFLNLGKQLLMNPYFLVAAVTIAIVVAVALVLQKFGKLQMVIDFLMIPVKALIEGFKKLTDWMGLTSFAADENAERVAAANEKIQESSKDRAKTTDDALAHEIRMAKIAGKDTTYLELQRSMVAQREAYIRIKANQKEILSKMHDTSKEGIAARKKLKDQIKAENDLIKTGQREREAIRAQSVVNASKPDKVDKPVGGGGGGFDDGAKNRLAAKRAFADFEISIIKDAGEREIATVNEKYKRMQEDLVKDKDKTKAEKERFTEIYLAQQKDELDLLAKNKAKTEADNLLAGDNMIAELRLSMMVDGTEKELAMTKNKYNKLRKAALDNITLTETQKAELTKIYNEQEVAENKKRNDDKIAADTKAQVDLLASLQAQDVIAQEARKAKLAKDLETANNDAATIKAINDNYQAESVKMENDAATAKVDAAQRERDAKLTLASDIAKGITDIGGMLIKDQAKAAKLNKASALFQLGIDTAKAISALVAAANSNPLNGVTAGGAGIAQYVAGAIQIATNMAKAKQILSNPAGASGVGGGGGGGGGSSAGSNTATVVPQGPNLFGSANTGNTMSAGGVTDSSMTVTAIVSETQVTSVQNKINRINKSAEL